MDNTIVDNNSLEDFFTNLPDNDITDGFRARAGLSEDDVIAELQRIGSLLENIGIPHVFMAGFNTGSKTEFMTHTHTVGASTLLEIMIKAICINNPDYETFFISLGRELEQMVKSGEMNQKRFISNGNFPTIMKGVPVPDILFGKYVNPSKENGKGVE